MCLAGPKPHSTLNVMYQIKVLHDLQNENMLMAAQYVMFFARGITVSIFASFVGVLQNAKKGEVFSM